MQAGPSTLFGDGWRAVESFNDVEDIDEYETDEEEIYVTLDLGHTLDPRAISQAGEYQLIGLDTPTPFLRVGNHIFRGQVEEMLGSEVIYGVVRDPLNPHNAHHPPRHIADHRIAFQPVQLTERKPVSASSLPPTQGTESLLGANSATDGPDLEQIGEPSNPPLGEDDDYFNREAERGLIANAARRGLPPIARTRRGGKKAGEPVAKPRKSRKRAETTVDGGDEAEESPEPTAGPSAARPVTEEASATEQ